MPPLRSDGRASKACHSCRRLKTRCYATGGSCLRCKTLGTACSLEAPSSRSGLGNQQLGSPEPDQSVGSNDQATVSDRLARLEQTVSSLVSQLQADRELQHGRSRDRSANADSPHTQHVPGNGGVSQDAPVLLIRNAAAENGVRSPEQVSSWPIAGSDIILRGFVSLQDAEMMLAVFVSHYGRWLLFEESRQSIQLMQQVRKFPLLLCSICLVAVRHTTQELASELAPALFREARSLLQACLLTSPQPVEFFQSALILSLWSTSIGQTLLSIDSWLLTSFSITQALISPPFSDLANAQHLEARPGSQPYDATCIWNHLCLAHLQYCVGTRRKCLLSSSQIDQCASILRSAYVTDFEERMVAEVQLYWTIYVQCSASHLNLVEAEAALERWKDQWRALYSRPQSRLLRMGYNFGSLLFHCHMLSMPSHTTATSYLATIVILCKNVINIAIDSADERTQHLTDHIYHVITFAAITLSRVMSRYKSKFDSPHLLALDSLIVRLVAWLDAIGLPSHVSRLLGNILSTEHRQKNPWSRQPQRAGPGSERNKNRQSPTLPSEQRSTSPSNSRWVATEHSHGGHTDAFDATTFGYADPSWTSMFDLAADPDIWPEWDAPLYAGSDVSNHSGSIM